MIILYIFNLLLIIFVVILKLTGSILSIFIYPIVYIFRWQIRSNEILVPKYLYKPKKGLFFFWIWLNDSEVLDGTWTEYGDSEKYFPKWIWKSGSEFLRSYYFNSWRNALVNLNNYFGKYYLVKFVNEVSKTYFNNHLIFIFRIFKNRYNNFIILPAIHIYLFGKKFNTGFARSGRFWTELFKEIK